MTKNKKSRLLSLVLRHKPEHIGLTMDSQGWCNIDELLVKSCLSSYCPNITRQELEDIVSSNDKQRFIISEDGLSIRANQGHSVDIDLNLDEVRPPHELLFHGTAKRFVKSIMNKGLVKGQRNHVHMSGDLETAFTVGARHGNPTILRIMAIEMYDKGYKFYLSKNGVWLTDYVPTEYIY